MSSRPGPTLTGGTPLRGLDESTSSAGSSALSTLARSHRPAGRRCRGAGHRGRTIATTDTVVLGRDWLDAWSSGADVGHKVVAQNLADVAAMGGRPTGVLVTLVTDPMVSVDWVVDLGRGASPRPAIEPASSCWAGTCPQPLPEWSWCPSRRSAGMAGAPVLPLRCPRRGPPGRVRVARPRRSGTAAVAAGPSPAAYDRRCHPAAAHPAT